MDDREHDHGRVISRNAQVRGAAQSAPIGDRKFVLRIPGAPAGGPFGANVVMYNDEFVASEIGQVGTQFDGLAHIGVAINGPTDKREIRYYNGITQIEKEPGCVFCIHSHLLTRHGIVNQENMDLDGLSADKAYRFLYVFSPVPFTGATGSPGAPLAIR